MGNIKLLTPYNYSDFPECVPVFIFLGEKKKKRCDLHIILTPNSYCELLGLALVTKLIQSLKLSCYCRAISIHMHNLLLSCGNTTLQVAREWDN